jgi:hypothetical protein
LKNKDKCQKIRPIGNKRLGNDNAFVVHEKPADHFYAEKSPSNGEHNSEHIRYYERGARQGGTGMAKPSAIPGIKFGKGHIHRV